jgi:hypothetical protein
MLVIFICIHEIEVRDVLLYHKIKNETMYYEKWHFEEWERPFIQENM